MNTRGQPTKKNHLKTIQHRLSKLGKVEEAQVDIFCETLARIDLPENASALSLSTGDGCWDFLVFTRRKEIKTIIATDIVDNPLPPSDQKMLNRLGRWKFVKVKAEAPLKFTDNQFDLVYHNDVIEHVKKPHLFLSEQYRVLVPGGKLIFSTPNLLRPANLFRLLAGSLNFPYHLGRNEEIGNYVHIQEFTEWSLKNLLLESGFTKLQIFHAYFGIGGIELTLSSRPTSRLGQNLCHYLLVLAYKPPEK